ncbi:hypothetical protein RJ641_016987 [Dillenia turbinata]|uniref:Uncharacterized protein n=1 Tax=Dillenia turbinata TaxID=194707 RepID=A0AAN8UMY3_9MAGN
MDSTLAPKAAAYIVVIIGAAPSATDISREIFPLAKEVHQPREPRMSSLQMLAFRYHKTLLRIPLLKICPNPSGLLKFYRGKWSYQQAEMTASVEELYRHMVETGWPKRFTHNLQLEKVRS